MAKRSKFAKTKQGLGKKLDSVLFGITPEYRRSLGFKNPAKGRRTLYRVGLAAGHAAAKAGKAAAAGIALAKAEGTKLFRASGPIDQARESFLAGYLDGYAIKKNPAAEGAFAKCVKAVTAEGGASDPRAVCAAAGRKKLGQAEMTRRAKAGKKRAAKKSKRNPRNPLDTAEAAFEGFHGEKAKHTFKLQDKRHVHDVVWAFGPLVYLKVWLPTDRRVPGLRNFVEIEFDYEGKNPVYVTANEKRNQMFFDGGDQSVSLKTFGVPPEPHETVVLGEVSDAYYFTTKKHLGDQGGTAIYKHKLGEEGGELPTLIYHCIEKRLSLAGGSYTIPNEGVRN